MAAPYLSGAVCAVGVDDGPNLLDDGLWNAAEADCGEA